MLEDLAEPIARIMIVRVGGELMALRKDHRK